MKMKVVLVILIVTWFAIACSGKSTDDESGTESRTVPAATAMSTPTAEVVPPTVPPTPRLQLTSLDCGLRRVGSPASYVSIISASGTLVNSGSQPFVSLGVQLVLSNPPPDLPPSIVVPGTSQMIPYVQGGAPGPYVGIGYRDLPPAESLSAENVAKTAIPVEPTTLTPGQAGSFQFPEMVDPLRLSGEPPATQCSVRFVECTNVCAEIPATMAEGVR